MKLEILSDQPVSPNLKGRDARVACAYPQTTVLDNGQVACLYRQGREKHSYDGILVVQLSSDHGYSWPEPQVAFDGRGFDPPQSVVSGGICQTQAGDLLITFSLVDASHPEAYLFSEEAREFARQVCVSHSKDQGRTWGEATVLNTSPFVRAGITSKPLVLHDGQILAPVEVEMAQGPQGTAATFSEDDGQSFGPVRLCVGDAAGRLNLCDAQITTLDNGDLLMLLWTFVQETEETINVHRCVSADGGRSWSAPEPTEIQGQLTAPLALPSGHVIAASNYRVPPEGIRLWLSRDGGRSWDKDEPFQMWDPEQCCMLGEAASTSQRPAESKGVWDELEAFTFGTPDLVSLADGSVLLTYYATIDNIIHVRACRFRLSE